MKIFYRNSSSWGRRVEVAGVEAQRYSLPMKGTDRCCRAVDIPCTLTGTVLDDRSASSSALGAVLTLPEERGRGSVESR